MDIPWDGGGAGNDVNSTYTVCSLGEVKKSKKYTNKQVLMFCFA